MSGPPGRAGESGVHSRSRRGSVRIGAAPRCRGAGRSIAAKTRQYAQIRERIADAIGLLREAPGPGRDALREAGAALLDLQARLVPEVHPPPLVLQVRSDVLCVPVLGELDAASAARLREAVVAMALAHEVGLVVLDGRVFARLRSR